MGYRIVTAWSRRYVENDYSRRFFSCGALGHTVKTSVLVRQSVPSNPPRVTCGNLVVHKRK